MCSKLWINFYTTLDKAPNKSEPKKNTLFTYTYIFLRYGVTIFGLLDPINQRKCRILKMEYFFVTQERKKKERERERGGWVGCVRVHIRKWDRSYKKKLVSPALNSYLQFTHMYEHKCIESDGHEQVDYWEGLHS